MATSIGLMGLVSASLLLCFAQPFQPAPKLYRAKPEDVPPWAEQGNFRFIRLDGGRIESWKAERTWWGKKFSAEEKDVLTHIYDRDFEQMLGLLKQAEFNWIWVTWSSGWSLKDEDENREDLKKAIARCHENGIHVSAYLSASNMFRKSAYRDDPETRNYGLWMHGIPMFYAGPTKSDLQISWDRRLADTRKSGWRAYLLKKAELAVDAGVDAIMWDNMIGYDDGLAQLLDDTQRMAERKAQQTGRPKVVVEANVHIPTDRFAMNDINEVIWEEDGKDTPGMWNGHWQVDNARKIKFLSGEKQLWQPLKYENDLYHCGPRERCIPGPAEQKLSIAEAYAFGAATSRNIEGRFLSADFLKAKRNAKRRFCGWLRWSTGQSLDPDSIFDCQVKRIHEYKRQLLNALRIVVLYNRLRQDPGLNMHPRTFFFAGKAAPAYRLAKVIIKFINNLAVTIDADLAVRGQLKVVFLPEYCVSLAEHLIPASDVSNQISTAGYEASGTSNMKFMMNGALTIGTRDGATIEMAAEAGEENFFLFGLTAEQVIGSRGWYNPRWHYEHEPEIRQALGLIFSDYFSRYEPGVIAPLRDMLLTQGDHYMHLADLQSYLDADERLRALYADPDEWVRKAILNVAGSGKFSSDRTITEYAAEIWGVRPCPIPEKA